MKKLLFLLLLLPCISYCQVVRPQGKLNDNSGYQYWFINKADSGLLIHFQNQLTIDTVQLNRAFSHIAIDSTSGRYYIWVRNDSLKVCIDKIVNARITNDSIKVWLQNRVYTYLTNDSLRVSLYGKVLYDTTGKSTVSIRSMPSVNVNMDSSNTRRNVDVYHIYDSIKASIYGSVIARITGIDTTGNSTVSIRSWPTLQVRDTIKYVNIDNWRDSSTLSRREVLVRNFPDTSGRTTVTVRDSVRIWFDSAQTRRVQNQKIVWDTTGHSTVNLREKVKPDTTGASTFTIRNSSFSVTVDSNLQRRQVHVGKIDTIGASTVTIRSMPSITLTQDTTKGTYIRQWIGDTLNIKGNITVSQDSTKERKTINIERIDQQDTSKSLLSVRVINQSAASDSSAQRIIQNATINAKQSGSWSVDSSTQRVIQNARVNANITNTTIPVTQNSEDSTNAKLSRLEQLIKTGFGYTVADSIVETEVTSTIEMDSLTTDFDWQRVWYPDSTKAYFITFISICSGDSTIGFQIIDHKMTATTSTQNILKNTRLTGNAVVVMNMANAPYKLDAGHAVYVRRILPNGAIYAKYNEGTQVSGVFGTGLRICIKYRKY